MSSMNIEAVKKAVKNSNSFSEAIKKLGLVPNGRANSRLQGIVAENNIDTSHFNQRSFGRKAANVNKKAATKTVVVKTEAEVKASVAQAKPIEEFVLLNHTLDKVKQQVAISLTFSEAAARLGASEVNLKRVVYKYSINVSHFKTSAAKQFIGLPDPPKTVTEVLVAKKVDQESQTFAKTLYGPGRIVEEKVIQKVDESVVAEIKNAGVNLENIWKKYEGKLAGPWEIRKVKGQETYQRKASNGNLIGQVLVKGVMSFVSVFEKQYDEYYSLIEAQTAIDSQLTKLGFFLVPGENDPKGKLPEPSSIAVGVYKLGDNQSVIIKNGYLVIKEG